MYLHHENRSSWRNILFYSVVFISYYICFSPPLRKYCNIFIIWNFWKASNTKSAFNIFYFNISLRSNRMTLRLFVVFCLQTLIFNRFLFPFFSRWLENLCPLKLVKWAGNLIKIWWVVTGIIYIYYIILSTTLLQRPDTSSFFISQ